MSPFRDRSPVTFRAWCAAAFGYGAFLSGATAVHGAFLRNAYAEPVEAGVVLLAAAIPVLGTPLLLSSVAAWVVGLGRRRTVRLLSVAVFVAAIPAALFPLPSIGLLFLGLSVCGACLVAFPHTLLLSDAAHDADEVGVSGMGGVSFAAGALAVRICFPDPPPADASLMALSGLLAASVLPFLVGAGHRPASAAPSVSLHLSRALATSRDLRFLTAAAGGLVGAPLAAAFVLRGHAHLLGDARLVGLVASAETTFVAGAAVGAAVGAMGARRIGIHRAAAAAGGAGAAGLFLAVRPSPSLFPLEAGLVGACAGASYALLRAAAMRLSPEAGGAPLGAAVLAGVVPTAFAGCIVLFVATAALLGPSAGMGALSALAAAGAAAAWRLPRNESGAP